MRKGGREGGREGGRAHLDLLQKGSSNVGVHVNTLFLLHQFRQRSARGRKEEGAREVGRISVPG